MIHGRSCAVCSRNRVFDVLSEINISKSNDDIIKKFKEYVFDLGFDNILMTGLPGYSEDLKEQIYINGWSEDWFGLYFDRSFYQHDSIAAHARDAIHPFKWSSVPYDRSNRRSKAVMDAACDFKMLDGFCVPIFGARGKQSCVTMAAEKPELNEEIEASLHLVSIYAHHALCENLSLSKTKTMVLSEREREVLRWVSDGKTNWEIGEILGISQRTVHGHIQNASRKLGAYSRTSTVVKAIKAGEVPLE